MVFDYLQTKAPPVYDPFCGGGSIPLEAQRLGLRAYGSDLNPVAVLISKALVEIPPKFAGLPPVNPESQALLGARASRPHKAWHERGYLPHFDAGATVQSLTFRLADSLPRAVFDDVAAGAADDADRRRRLDAMIDEGRGACLLRVPEHARIVSAALKHFDGARYRLLAWVVMPNHVHVLIEQVEGFRLGDVVHSWKSFSAKEINRRRGSKGSVWAPDYFDRYIRDDAHFAGAKRYIEENPVKAGLVASPEDWEFSSAAGEEAAVTLGARASGPQARGTRAVPGTWQGKGAQGLAEDVRYYGRWMRDEAKKRIGHLYPQATLPDGSQATVIAWLWARTVASPNPAANGAHVPLVSSFMLSTKEGKKAWVEPVIDPNAPDGWRFQVKSGPLSKAEQDRLKGGTKTGRGEFTCLLTGATIDGDYLRGKGKSGDLSTRLMAVFVDTGRGKLVLSPDELQEKCAASAEPQWVPEGEMFKDALGFRVPNYGITEWSGLFTKRQLTSLATFADLVSEVGPRITQDAIRAGASAEYAKAVQTYLGFALGRVADLNCMGCTWLPDLLAIAHIFARHAISMTWDFAECNPVEDKWQGACEWVARVIEVLPAIGFGEIIQLPAQRDSYPLKDAAFFSDPPYYDNIGYADLSDFFICGCEKLFGIAGRTFSELCRPRRTMNS